MVSGIAKKAVMSVRQQKPEYIRKAPPRPKKRILSSLIGDWRINHGLAVMSHGKW